MILVKKKYPLCAKCFYTFGWKIVNHLAKRQRKAIVGEAKFVVQLDRLARAAVPKLGRDGVEHVVVHGPNLMLHVAVSDKPFV